MPEVFADVGHCVDAVLRRVGPRIVLALPLGIGKPNPLVNEFYRRALRDSSIDLTIVTALSLLKPVARSALEARLLAPLAARVFGTYVEPEYARAMQTDTVPPNVRILEFFLTPGAFLDSRHAQRHYLSANYTHVARDCLARGVNVIAHLVAQRSVNGELQLSLGSNPDVTVDLLPLIEGARVAGRDIVMVGQTHAQMPFMTGHALIDPGRFDFLVDHPRYDYDLFCPPNPPLGTVEHAIGMYASALVRDGGTLQIGIGELGDSLVYALLLRHQQNAAWRGALEALGSATATPLMQAEGGDAPFSAGLFAATEMFVDQLLELYRAGILRRRVYDSLPLERLLSSGQTLERFDERILGLLAGAGAGPLRNGQVLHAGFFLGPRGFYAALRELPESERAQFGMRGVAFVNQLYGADQELRVLQRRAARCINTTMMVTLLGAAVSDALESGRVVSGVGGQYNFVAMAHALPGARSILCVRATRTRHGRTTSNIVWSYGHQTIPRHLRDLVVTEYGIAELRGRTDEEVIAALLNVADSRFQDALLSRARAAGKIRADYRIPDAFRNNLPQRLTLALREHRRLGYFSEYPFGTDLTEEEIALARALKFLEAHTGSAWGRLKSAAASLGTAPASRHASALRRMGLDQPHGLSERLQRRLIVLGLDASA